MNTAYNIDCVKGMEMMLSDSIDLTVTSPPYDNLRDYHGYKFDYQATLKELYRVTRQGGIVVWIVADQTIDGSESGTSFKQALYAKDVGFNLHDTMIWDKGHCVYPEATRYQPTFEYMFVFSKGKPKTTNLINDKPNLWRGTSVHGTYREKDGTTTPRDKKPIIKEFGARNNVWRISPEKNNKTKHPAVFPLQLPIDHIRTWSVEGDVVLDPFLGSGTTRIAAYMLGRNFIGFEISKEYFDAQEERFQTYTAQTNLFDVSNSDEGQETIKNSMEG